MNSASAWWNSLIRMPRRVGSIMPSSAPLARRMAREAAQFLRHAGRSQVIEVGAGTGAITHALAHAVGSQAFTVVEADHGCCAVLRRRFPRLHVLEGLIEDHVEALLAPGRPLALVSSVPLFSLTPDQRGNVLAAFESLVRAAGHARVVQFTYMPWLPGQRARRLVGGRPQPVWRNVPPAWVWSATHRIGSA